MRIWAETVVDGIPVNPVLPKHFYGTDNRKRPNSPWWYVPYVRVFPCPYEEGSEHLVRWLEAWPSGNRFDTYCLDGGAWDRLTAWGKFATLEEAIRCALEGPVWRA
jgi:hypothetical protein